MSDESRNLLVVTFEDSAEPVKVCVRVCVHACMPAYVHVCVCMCARMYVRAFPPALFSVMCGKQ